jgi:SHAQKYF class myb-like DNA-binding protein
MAFELPPRLRLEQERRAEKQPKVSSNGSSGSTKKGVLTAAHLHARGQARGAGAGVMSRHVMICAGQPWTSEEHLQFLAGLKKLGRSNWRGISRYFVPTRTPTQVNCL